MYLSSKEYSRRSMAAFKTEDVNRLMVSCHRRCCICHRFCGVKMEIDHIVQVADGGTDDIKNGIPVCFECHAEIHSYNDRHPRGRKFHPEELRLHKEQWLNMCTSGRDAFDSRRAMNGVGPLQALVDELEFNETVALGVSNKEHGCLFMDGQFRRAIRQGAIAVLQDDLKRSLIRAYQFIGRANQHILCCMRLGISGADEIRRASNSIYEAQTPIREAHEAC